MERSKYYDILLNKTISDLQYLKSIQDITEYDIKATLKEAITGYKNRGIIISHEEIIDLEASLNFHFATSFEEDEVDASLLTECCRSNWWSTKKNRENYYAVSYEKFLRFKQNFPEDTINRVAERAEKILDYLFDPVINEPIKKYGMVMGSVQAGKTSNYIELVCQAADAGFNVIIVIAGSSNLLRQQTQIRLSQGFVGYTDKNKFEKNLDQDFTTTDTVAEFQKQRSDIEFDRKRPISLTSERENGDFHKQKKSFAELINLEQLRNPVLFVIKKEKSVLTQLANWLKNQDPKFSLLIIDDEADNASINTKKDDSNRTAINKGIRKLMTCFNKCAYVAFTATPFANIFIDPLFSKSENDKDLFPKDFMLSIASPNNYLGPQTVFSENMPEESLYVNILEPKEKPADWVSYFPLSQKYGETANILKKQNNLPESLINAILIFIFNIAIRDFRGFTSKHNSMLINVSYLTDMHTVISEKVTEQLKSIRKDVSIYSAMILSQEYLEKIKPILELYQKHKTVSISINESLHIKDSLNLFPTEEILLNRMPEIIDSIVVAIANKNENKLKYDQTRRTNIIAIGGYGLSRGFTLEGLNTSYIIRNTKLCDTLLQMGRWFGYRPHYQDLCRIFMTEEMFCNFCYATDATASLVYSISEMEKNNKTPSDFQLTVHQHPACKLLLTAKNKMHHAKKENGVDLNGQIRECGTFKKDELQVGAEYLSVIKELFKSIKQWENIKEGFLVRGISSKIIIEIITKCPKLFKYEFAQDQLVKYIDSNSNITWRILLPSKKNNDSGIYSFEVNKIQINKFRRFNRNIMSQDEKCRFSMSDKEMESSSLTQDEIKLIDVTQQTKRFHLRATRSEPVLILFITDLFEHCTKAEQANVPDEKLLCRNFPLVSISFAGSPAKPVFTTLLADYIINKEVEKQLQIEHEILEAEADDDIEGA